jgi:hypothetical protein
MASRSLPLLALLPAFASCGDAAQAPRVQVATSLLMPRALLDRVTKLTITVLEGDAACDVATGKVTPGTAREIVTKRALGTSGCAAGAKFCGELTIDKSDAVRVFSATGTGDGDAVLATGCASAKVDADAVPVAIKMVRFLSPAVCGDGTLQPTEQCEPGGSALCDETCQSNELLLSVGASANKTSTGVVGDKTSPSLLWPTGSAAAGWFYAFYTDRATGFPNNSDVAMRVMGDDLSALSSPPAPVAFATASLFLPNGSNSGALPPTAAPYQQSLPKAALASGVLWVAFQDEDVPQGNGVDVHLRSMDVRGVPVQGLVPIGVNGAAGAGEAGIQGAPAIAGSAKGRVFVAWEDATGGKIAGRTVTSGTPPTLGTQNDLSTNTGNVHVSVAPTTSGWVAVWQSGTGIKLRVVNEDGTPQGAELLVNDGAAQAEKPEVASLPDGRFAVTWSAGGDVFVQRYDAKGAKVAGDQASPVNDRVTAGTQGSVAITSTSAAGGSYVLAWLDEDTGHVRARMLGGDRGFLFNNVDGQASEFQASRVDGRTRATPSVIAGGSGPYVAVGWEDRTSGGIVVRRLPVPTE